MIIIQRVIRILESEKKKVQKMMRREQERVEWLKKELEETEDSYYRSVTMFEKKRAINKINTYEEIETEISLAISMVKEELSNFNYIL